jgi:hypothetical protein
MRTTPRPDGVPAELQTDAIAAAIAEAIWTVDGEAWDSIVAGGSCGESSCQLEVAGARSGTAGDDVWTFGVVPSTTTVTVESTELRAIPESLVEALDDLVRSLVAAADLEGMLITAATWQPPPAADRYTVAYRSGGEEGSCGLEVVVEPRSEQIVDRRSIGSC